MIESPAEDRISEIAEILATGLTRLEARKSSRKSAEIGESSLHAAMKDAIDTLNELGVSFTQRQACRPN
jgi:hypothetical protein